MVSYKVKVTTGSMLDAGTLNNVFIKLVGTEGESNRTWLFKVTGGFYAGAVSEFDVSCTSSLGSLILVELDKQKLPFFPNDNWFCSKVVVTTPDGSKAHFPCYSWISDEKVVRYREGTAKRVFDDSNPLEIYERTTELKKRGEQYRWSLYADGLPYCLKVDNPLALPPEVRFSFTKSTEFLFTAASGLAELQLQGLADSDKQWSSIDDINRVFLCQRTPGSDYVQEHWKEDEFFGYQFLNGINPMMIQRCSKLPDNFPVTDNMVKDSIEPGSTLTQEIKKGNIFFSDYKRLDGISSNIIHGKQQYLAAPLCLLYKNPKDKLMPIAIQLKQKPGDDNPIFLPSDSEYDWLLAKMYVKNAEFSEHQLNFHLLRTHLLAEVFAVSTLRNLPMVHPLFKLLIPHTRYTLQINYLARLLLISKTGVFTKYTAIGGDGMFTALNRAVNSLTYSSLCIPEDITARGLESIPNFHYRDDGLNLWNIIHRFSDAMVKNYYPTDSDICKDTELQAWIKDIFVNGFFGNPDAGIPQSFTTVQELIKFVTMVIFTGSVQHSAVNSGQYDFGGWMPNSPTTMQRPPPTTKRSSSERTMLETLPDIGTTVNIMSTVWLLSRKSTDFIPLGDYPDQHFTEDAPLRIIKEFQEELKSFAAKVQSRNSTLKLPYNYLLPEEIENSVAI